jgi:hypothetical protein
MCKNPEMLTYDWTKNGGQVTGTCRLAELSCVSNFKLARGVLAMRKESVITLGVALLVVGLLIARFKTLYAPWLCSEQTLMEKTSPDGRYVAVLMRRSCRWTKEPPTAHINIRLASSAPFPNHVLGGRVQDGEIFGTSRDSGERFCWSGPRQLEIDFLKGHTQHPGRWMDVSTGGDYSLCQ